MTDLPGPTILRGSRTKAAKLLAMGAVFLALGAFLFLAHVNRGLGAICAVTFACIVVLGLRGLLFPPELEVGDDGLRWRGYRAWQVSWSDLKEFTVWRARRASAVRITYVSAEPKKGSRRPDLIPNTLWLEPDELADLLSARLAEARANGVVPSGQIDHDTPEVPLPAVVAWPRLSLAIVAVLAIVFAAELAVPLTPPSAPLTPSTVTLAGFGGLGRNLLTGADQWYRFATAPFLHGSLGHLLANGFALFLAGRLLEGVVGAGWFAAIYVIGALAGGCGSLLINPANVVTVGASGAIVALFAAAFVLSFHYPRFGGRHRLQSGSIAILLPTLFTVGRSSSGMRIDFGAHLGGAIGGALVGAAILVLWRSQAAQPSHQRLGAAIGTLGLLAAILAIWPVALRNDIFSRVAMLVPDTLMPKSDADVIEHAADLEARFPHDPRIHLAAAMGNLSHGDPVQAAVEARTGLHDMDAVRILLQANVEAGLWLVLGESFMRRGLSEEAQANYDKAAAIEPQLPGLDYDEGTLSLARGRLDDALTSATRATERESSVPTAWRLLGDVQFAKGEVAKALDAYKRENKLSSSESSFRMTGLTRFYSGDIDGALFDLRRGLQDGRVGYYSAIWLDIVTERSGKPQTLDGLSLVAGDQQWPAPVIQFLQGSITQDALRAAATSAAPNPGKSQMCEADFYASEWTLIHGGKNDAYDGFKRAIAECPPDFVEPWMARAELAGGATEAQ